MAAVALATDLYIVLIVPCMESQALQASVPTIDATLEKNFRKRHSKASGLSLLSTKTKSHTGKGHYKSNQMNWMDRGFQERVALKGH